MAITQSKKHDRSLIGKGAGKPDKCRFDGGIKLEFHDAKVISDGELLAYRDLDQALELFV